MVSGFRKRGRYAHLVSRLLGKSAGLLRQSEKRLWPAAIRHSSRGRHLGRLEPPSWTRRASFFSHGSSAVNSVIGGWQLSAFHQFHSGPSLTPNFTPSRFQELSNSGGVQYRPIFGVDRKRAHQRLHVPGHPEQAFCNTVYSNPSQAAYNGCTVAFATVNPDPAKSADPRGDVPNGFLRGDSHDELDAGINKSFNLPWERMRLDFRGQFYNVLNKTNFTVPGMSCCSTSFGRITSTYGPGRIGVQARLVFQWTVLFQSVDAIKFRVDEQTDPREMQCQ